MSQKLNAQTTSSKPSLRPFFSKQARSEQEIRMLQSNLMKKYMNNKTDPCDDFYDYACGNWKKYFIIPPDRTTYDTFEMVRENLDNVIRDILDDIEVPPVSEELDQSFRSDQFARSLFQPSNQLNPTSALVKVKHFYMSCMNQDVINGRGDEPLMRIINQLGGWPILNKNWNLKNFDTIWVLAQLRLLNNDVLISEWVGPDMKNSNEYIIHIDQTSLGLPSREYYVDPANIKYLNAYKAFITEIVHILGGRNVQKDVNEIVDFEINLAVIMSSSEDKRNVSDVYLRTDLETLPLYFPQFDWHKYFSIILGRTVNPQYPVACYCSEYLQKLTYRLSVTPERVIQNYILWRFIRHRTSNLGHKFTDAKQRFYNVLFGREEEPPRWTFCVSQANANMGMAVGALFVKKYFDKGSRNDTIHMTEQLEAAFRDTLLENLWLDNHTKEYARMKINQMDLKIGFPDFILNEKQLAERYDDIQIHPEYFFENILLILRHLTRSEQTRIGNKVNRSLWSTSPAVVNAYYSRNKNQILFPAGILQPPFYHKFFPKALNFGGIGVVIGHEITHGFDDKGRLFDHEGNLHLWWREASIQKFYAKATCLINQYSRFVLPEINSTLDGFLTQGENIADNGGLKQAFRAYSTWLKSNNYENEKLPGMDLNGKQLFFLNFAQVWCGQQRLEAAKSRMKTSVHAPGIFRVIGALSNSEDFARAYNCPKGSPMNPVTKCTIW
ncbi:neprilysin-4-like [Aethina tumida]|uniref:neprilysin-4-like n=1 Tax=Aethina tumida TaxID=116153 RepID=UPI0021489010|nr:neprilysin-4-like [Aethina tumida]